MKKKKYTTPLVAYADIVPAQTEVSEQVISDELMDGADALVNTDPWQGIW